MDANKLSSFKMSVPPRAVEITEANGEPTGLTLVVMPKSDPRYKKVEERVQTRMNNIRLRGRTPKPAEQEEMNRELSIARICDLKAEGRILEKLGVDKVPFNKSNVAFFMFECGEFSNVVRDQIDEAARMMSEGFGVE